MENIDLDDVYIILVNYKNPIDTVECLESVLKLDYSSFKVIVIDNSEENSSIEAIKSWAHGDAVTFETDFPDFVYPSEKKPLSFSVLTEGKFNSTHQFGQLTIVEAKENAGFAAANNIALRHLLKIKNVGFVWLLNNDTVVDKNALRELINYAKKDSQSKVGIWGSKLLMYYNPSVIQGVGGTYNKWFGKVKEVGSFEKDNKQWDIRKFDMDYVIGASMLVKKEFIEDVGLMEEDYFLYYEELDWAIRGKRKGWALGFCPSSKVYHKMGASINTDAKISRGNSVLADFYSARNRILIAKKYFPYTLFTLYPAFLKFAINRLYLRQFSRLTLLIKVILNPQRHIN